MANVRTAIGIDLGTSKMVFTKIDRGGVSVICNEANYRSTPP